MNIETQIFEYFKPIAFDLGYDVEHMYQTPNPGELYGMVTNRIAAGRPCLFVRVVDIPVSNEDTSSAILNGRVQIELILAQVPLSEFEGNSEREIFKTRSALINAVRSLPITINPDPRPALWNFTSLGRSLFRDGNIDALALSCFRNIVIDFDENFP